GRHRAEDCLGEVDARLDHVHINEDLALAETIDHEVSQPAGKIPTLVPTVADENATTLSYGHGRYATGEQPGRKAAISRAAASVTGEANPLERMMNRRGPRSRPGSGRSGAPDTEASC